MSSAASSSCHATATSRARGPTTTGEPSEQAGRAIGQDNQDAPSGPHPRPQSYNEPVSEDETLSLAEQLQKVVEAVAAEIDRPGTTREVPSVIDAAARSLGAAMASWGANESLRRFVGGIQRDFLTGRGEWVELTAQLGVASKLGSVACFYVDGQVVAEVPLQDGSPVRAMIRAPEPGLHQVGMKVCDATGAVVIDAAAERILQVAGERPVTLVDAGLIVDRERSEEISSDLVRQAVQALVDGGCEIAYFDIDDKNRDAAIRDAMRATGLPRGAVLIHAAEDETLRGLGLDFAHMFGLMAVRRLRAKGVPVMMIVTEIEPNEEHRESDQLQTMTVEEVIARAGTRGFDPEIERAHRFVRSHEATERASWRLDQATGSTLVSGNRFHAELDNQRARNSLFNAIDSARESIHLQFYIVRPSAFTETLIVKLVQRSRVGVRVRFMVDALYSDEGPDLFSRRGSYRDRLGIDNRAIDAGRLRDHL